MNRSTVHHDASTPGTGVASIQREQRLAYSDLPLDRLADEIERLSVDGRAAHPELGPRGLRRFVALYMGVVLITGALVAMLVDLATGLGLAALGGVGLFVNPELWATLFRARERRRAQRRIAQATRPSPFSRLEEAEQACEPLIGESSASRADADTAMMIASTSRGRHE